MRRFALLAGLVLCISACTPEYANLDLPRPFRGGENATVKVEEFGDFQCPACGQAYPLVKELEEQFGDQVRWEYYHFPLTQIHPYAFNAAMAAECAHDQGKFWEMHDKMFENQNDLQRSDLEGYAEELGLSMDLYNACMKSRAKSDQVRSDVSSGEGRGVNSTPSFFVNGQPIDNWSQLESVLRAALQPAVPRQDSSDETTEE